MLSPMIAATAATTITPAIERWPSRREDGRGDQRGLSGEPEACGLETDDREQEPEPVVHDEVGHGRAGYRRNRLALVRIGVPRELEPGERRVALVPETRLARLAGAGFEIVVERGAGPCGLVHRRGVSRGGRELADDAGTRTRRQGAEADGGGEPGDCATGRC